MTAGRILHVGEPAPWFISRSRTNPRYVFDTVAGRYVVISFVGSAGIAESRRYLEQIHRARARFDDARVCFFGVTTDPRDESEGRVSDAIPGIRYLFDIDRTASALYGAVQTNGSYDPVTYVLDPLLRVYQVIRFNGDADAHATHVLSAVDTLPSAEPQHPALLQAPVLVLPRVFEDALCRALIDYYARQGYEASGFMREENGLTVAVTDPNHKRRTDCNVRDKALRSACMARIHDRLAPEVHKAFQFQATRMERYVVASYDGDQAGHFRPHRDNTTKGTAHRRFAVSVFLNTGEYEGGLLRFPEFGPALYSAPRGGAVVFSCSLLHEVTAVTKGRRFVFLPFLYDESARRLREQNFQYLEEELRPKEDQ